MKLLANPDSADLYLRMLGRQRSTAEVSVTDVIKEESKTAPTAGSERSHLRHHDLEYGIRVVEDFVRAQELERKGYFPSAEEVFDEPDRVSAEQYLAKMRAHGCFVGEACHTIDLCCGSGNITGKILAGVSPEECSKIHVRGIDVNEDAIAKAEKALAGVPEVRFLCANALRRKRCMEPADVVICNTSMHEFEKPHELLQAAARLATKLVVVKDLIRPEVLEFWNVARSRNYRGTMFQLFYESLKSSLSPDEMRALADREGFTFELSPPIYAFLTKIIGEKPKRPARRKR